MTMAAKAAKINQQRNVMKEERKWHENVYRNVISNRNNVMSGAYQQSNQAMIMCINK